MKLKEKIEGCLKAWRPIVYVYGTDFEFIDSEIWKSVKEEDVPRKIEEYNNASGCVDFTTKMPQSAIDEFGVGNMSCVERLSVYLDEFITDCPVKRIVVLKDVHEELRDSAIIAKLKAISWRLSNLDGYAVQLFIVSSRKIIPQELEKLVTVIDVPGLNKGEVISVVRSYCKKCDIPEISEDELDEITLSLRGLDRAEIHQVLNYVQIQTQGSLVSGDVVRLILDEKKRMIRKSNLLEPIEVSYDDNVHFGIGGLRNLIGYLKQKAYIFQNLPNALRFGVGIPKGILIVGMPGCGKSLAAKECARLFRVPLVRLDIGRLLGRYVGESEDNLRRALRHAEGAMPCVLWIDEIEKAFAGVGKDENGVTTRLFGQFLTWMQEKDAKFSTVYVVATANDLSGIPPEFLRRGRFDEIFSVGLPNDGERKDIFWIHLMRRLAVRKQSCDSLGLDIDELVEKTRGDGGPAFSGADIESIVKTAFENAFMRRRGSPLSDITQRDVLEAINTTRPIRETMKEKIKTLEDGLKKFQVTSASLGAWVHGKR